MADSSNGDGASDPKPSVSDFISADRISFIMFLLRLFTLYAGVMAMINPYSQHFQKVLVASAAVNALRLHQRVPRITLTAQTLQNILAEDSGHYLAFSLMFMSAKSSASMVLMPLVAFALMHSCSYLLKLFNETSVNQVSVIKNAAMYIRSKNAFLLQFIAMNEIFLMPIVVYLAFTGKGIFLPIIYYRFLLLRYSSERNPYNRMCFQQLNVAALQFCQRPSCPAFVRNIVFKGQEVIQRLAPQAQAQTQ